MAEGPKLLDEALRAGAAVEAVYLDATAGADHRELAARAAAAGATVHELQPGVLDRVCDAVAAQPVAAVLPMRHVPLDSLNADGLTVVAVGVQDPGNAGAIIRSAAASGTGAVVFCAGAVDIYNPKTVRASAGAMFLLPLVVAGEAEDVLDRLGGRGVSRMAAVARGGRDYDRIEWNAGTALVLGSESRGLPAGLSGLVDGQVTIPMRAGVESLNVAMAATVICFEAARQRRRSILGAV
ncbi:MAG TPA: RNA methyltransferase [Acidimicrobiales bacterium]|nr:RNA methyltransferase [Acidimicrobiales bacterium]